MSRNDKIDPSGEREEKAIAPAAHCEDGCCTWHDNSTAQSEGGSGDRNPKEHQVINPPQGRSRDPPIHYNESKLVVLTKIIHYNDSKGEISK